MMKRAMIGILVVAMMVTMAACGDDDDDNGGGSPGGGMLGEASFELTGDIEESVTDGGAYFDTLDLTDVSASEDYQFGITVSESVPVTTESTHIRFSYPTDDGDFIPEPGEYDVGFGAFAENWQGFLNRGLEEDLVADEEGDATLTIESASSSGIVGSFEVEFVEPVVEEDITVTASGSFSADPTPDR